ncbi:hypothetical protein GCM10023189_08510 [Nibrella saemangeumensis]|uniref:Outer membrane protein beta-barrel domain-containing protein n=1 Tax=Nibrella saemangeumensis TaxID=1084526 RepID=A0ABP8MGN8_9BACT
MKKQIYFSLMLLLLGSSAWAQKPVIKRPFVNYTEIGGLFGRVAFGPSTAEVVANRLNFTAQTFNGVQLTHQLAVGSTVGIDWYTAALLMPVSAGIRYDLARHPRKNVRVFTSADAGYGFAWLHKGSTGYETKGGLMISPGIGLKMGRPGNTAFIMSLSYKRQEADVQKPIGFNDIRREEHRVYNRIAFRVGVSF